MNFPELMLIAVGLSMDAFAISVCSGLTMSTNIIKKSIIIGLYFGFFQAIMPLAGYLLGSAFASKITAYDHWVAFILLSIIGGKMIIESIRTEGCKDRKCPDGLCPDRECPGGKKPDLSEKPLSPSVMLPLAVASSIDALAVGISFSFFALNIFIAITLIGLTTFILSFSGVKIGFSFGTRFKSKAETLGGVILILIGLRILLEHTGVL